MIRGILKPDSGKVRFKGSDITRHRSSDIVNQGIATTFQVVKPFRHLPCIANVMVACLSPRARKSGEWVKRVETKAQDALEFTGVADLALEPAHVMAHGDLKRLEIARAIATEPELLILDEPFGGLNPAETDLMVKSLRRLHRGGRFGRLHSEGPAMLVVEHKLSDLMKIIDRAVVLNFGKKIAEGIPQEIARNPEVVEAYTGKEILVA
jgi:branched-chain amino acid transport system ATP-binding protein